MKTIQEKIEVLEKAVTLINHKSNYRHGVCRAVHEAINGDVYDGREWDIIAIEWMSSCGIELPASKFHYDSYSWPLTEEGDEQRREFLRNHIERLKSLI